MDEIDKLRDRFVEAALAVELVPDAGIMDGIHRAYDEQACLRFRSIKHQYVAAMVAVIGKDL